MVSSRVWDKIFNPSLGLSLSYDIIKAHGGEMKWKRNKVMVQRSA
jgi:hypothetical protein